jgi:uncharacterized membrane protein
MNSMTENKEKPSNRIIFILASAGRALKGYLTDWRNLLGHAMLGVLFFILAIWAPVQIWIKLVIIMILITINAVRMRRKTRKKMETSQAIEEEDTHELV